MREMPYVWTREELQILSRLCAGIVLREFGGGLSTWDGSPASLFMDLETRERIRQQL
jgi:hypothetical protein